MVHIPYWDDDEIRYMIPAFGFIESPRCQIKTLDCYRVDMRELCLSVAPSAA